MQCDSSLQPITPTILCKYACLMPLFFSSCYPTSVARSRRCCSVSQVLLVSVTRQVLAISIHIRMPDGMISSTRTASSSGACEVKPVVKSMPSSQQDKSLRKEYYCAYLQVNVYGDRCAIDMTDLPRNK